MYIVYLFLCIYHRTIAQHVKAKDPTRLVTFVANADYKEEQAVGYYFFLTVNFIFYNTCTSGLCTLHIKEFDLIYMYCYLCTCICSWPNEWWGLSRKQPPFLCVTIHVNIMYHSLSS